MDKPNNISFRKYIENIYNTDEYKSSLSEFTNQLEIIFSQQSGLSNNKTIDSIIKLIEHEIETLSNKETLYSYNYKIDLLKTVFETIEENNNLELFILIKENPVLKSKQPTRNEHEQISEFIIKTYKSNYLSQDLKEEWAELIKTKFKYYSFSFQFDELLAILNNSPDKDLCYFQIEKLLKNRNIHLNSLVKDLDEELYCFLKSVKRQYMDEVQYNNKHLAMLESTMKTMKIKEEKDSKSSNKNISDKKGELVPLTVFGDRNYDKINEFYEGLSYFLESSTILKDITEVFTLGFTPTSPSFSKINLVNGTLNDYAYLITKMQPYFVGEINNKRKYNQWWADRFLFNGVEKKKESIARKRSAIKADREVQFMNKINQYVQILENNPQ